MNVPLESNSPEGFTNDQNLSAQLLLLCCWRTSKEISLILGQICPLLNEENLLETSQFFVNQLANIKHRGAFEQSFIGFCSVCSFMWTSEKYSKMPLKLLQDTLKGMLLCPAQGHLYSYAKIL